MTPARAGAGPDVVRAPAKLTRSLRVVGARRDGFHLLEAEMVTISLFDQLEIVSGGEGLAVIDEVAWSGEPATPKASGMAGDAHPARSGGGGVGARAVAPEPASARPGADLVERALAAVGLRALVSLKKRIPAGAGLGGGSADAAAVLRWAGCSDLVMASELGADVPFCLLGGRAMVGGIGEHVQQLPFEARHVVLVAPRVHVSTPAVYRAWDELGGPRGDYGNDLEPAALVVEPRLAAWRELVTEVAGRRPSLAGSGGTWWLDVDDGRAALRLEAELSDAVVAAGQCALVKSVETVPLL